MQAKTMLKSVVRCAIIITEDNLGAEGTMLYTNTAQKTDWLTLESILCSLLGVCAGILLSAFGMGMVCLLLFALWWINYLLH